MSLPPVFILCAALLYSSVVGLASVTATLCSSEEPLYLYELRSQCPSWILPNPPREVDGNFLDLIMNTKSRYPYASILFHASWCPFSRKLLRKFETLALMFPQIEHLTVERSSAFPSVFSRHGIHSLPSILLVNQTSKVWYKGAKDLDSLAFFYKKTTGMDLVHSFAKQSPDPAECENCMLNRVSWTPSRDLIKREPYLVFSVLFLLLRAILLLSPPIRRLLRSIFGTCVPQFSLGVFRGTRLLFERVFQVVDVRRASAKLSFCKARNFHEKAKSCRVWASSLASVSLGEASSSGR